MTYSWEILYLIIEKFELYICHYVTSTLVLLYPNIKNLTLENNFHLMTVKGRIFSFKSPLLKIIYLLFVYMCFLINNFGENIFLGSRSSRIYWPLPESEFEPRLKTTKNRFKLNAGGTTHIWAASKIQAAALILYIRNYKLEEGYRAQFKSV